MKMLHNSMGNFMTTQNVLTGLREGSYLTTASLAEIPLLNQLDLTQPNSQFVEWLKQGEPFRYIPHNLSNKPITVRVELRKGQPYWYGFLRLNGKLHKEYIGQLSDVTYSNLETVAQFLNHPGTKAKREKKVTQPVVKQSEILPVLVETIAKLSEVAETPRNNFSKDRKALLQSAIASLTNLAESVESL